MNEHEETLRVMYDRIADAPAPGLALALACKEAEDKAEEIFPLLEELPTEHVYYASKIIHPAIDYLQSLNGEEEDFYDKLWRQIDDNELIHEQGVRSAALSLVLIHPALPYVQANMVSMDPEEFVERLERLRKHGEMLIRLTRRNYFQRTQEASAYLSVIMSQEDERDRIMLMSYLVGALRHDASNSEGE